MRRFLIGLLVLFGLLWAAPAQAATTPKVLLAYDSQNINAQAERKVDSVQRLLTSLNLEVHTIAIDQYHQGDLMRYDFQGVITMINWPQMKFSSRHFVKDRQQFTGAKLHIGPQLAPDEQQALDVQVKTVHHQQFDLIADQHRQLLPFSDSMQLVTQKNQAKTIGTLKTQTPTQQPQYPYGVLNGRSGFLPYYQQKGLSFLAASQLISELFGRQTSQQAPLLTLTKVTPVSKLKYLDQVSQFLYQQGIPFAVSATSIQVNTDMPAFTRYMRALQKVENRNGIIFLQTPEIYDTTKKTGPKLGRVMYRQLTDLTLHQVIPVGISTVNYWNQDEVYRTRALGFSDHVLLLPNPKTKAKVYARQSNIGGVYHRTYYALPAESLATAKSGTDLTQQSELQFSVPTAVTVNLPSTKKGVASFKRQITRSRLSWYNPATANLKTNLKIGDQTFCYQSGSYFVNDQQITIPAMQVKQKKQAKPKPYKAAMNGFFDFQSHVLIVFIIIVLAILVVFFFIGRRFYRNMFRRK